jgi:hypothetical protein
MFFFLLVELFKSEQRLPFFRIRGFIFFGGKKKNVKILKIRGFENSLTPAIADQKKQNKKFSHSGRSSSQKKNNNRRILNP